MFKFVAIFAAAAVLSLGEASLFERCGLVSALREQGFPADKLADWVCLVEHTSGGYTDLVKTIRKNFNTPKTYSVFQINNQEWCSSSSTPGKACNVTCAELRSDDITKASQCAKLIYNLLGFHYWPGWTNHCQKPADLPDISNCTPDKE